MHTRSPFLTDDPENIRMCMHGLAWCSIKLSHRGNTAIHVQTMFSVLSHDSRLGFFLELV